jgi:hypothetical protein
MFRIYGEGDIIRAGDGFNTGNPFTHIEALQNNDFITADDLNRASKNLYDNQFETYEMLKSFSIANLDSTYIPNNNDPALDNSFKILSTNLNKVELEQVGGGTTTKYYLTIPQGVASISSGFTVHKIMTSVLERQIKFALSLVDKRESVIIKVQDNGGTGNPDRVMCKITKVISSTPTEIFFPASASTTFDDNDFTNYYYNTVELLTAINNYNDVDDFRGLLLDASGGFENFKGQQILDLSVSTDYDIYIVETTGLCEKTTTPSERVPERIYLAQVSIDVTPTIVVNDLRKSLTAPYGFNQIPSQEPMIYLPGGFIGTNLPRNESDTYFEFSSFGVVENITTLYGKSMYNFSLSTSYIQNETAFNSANGSVIGISFYLKPAGTATAAHLVGIADSTVNDTFDVHLNYSGGYYTLSGSTKLNYEIYVNAKRNYEPFTSSDIVHVFINFTSTNTPPIAGLIFGKTTHGSNTNAPIGMMIGEIRVYDDLPFNMNYIKGLYTLGNIFQSRKNATFNNLQVTNSLTANNIIYNEHPEIKGVKTGTTISYVPSDETNPIFKISEGDLHIRDGSAIPAQDKMIEVIDEPSNNNHASITLRPSISGSVDGITSWQAIACNGTGDYVLASDGTYVYISIDSGSTWKATTLSGNFPALTIDIDGSIMYAAKYNGKIWSSTNYGVTWAEISASSTKNWQSIDCGDDGVYIVAGTEDEYVYTSENSGTTWDQRDIIGGSTAGDWHVSLHRVAAGYDIVACDNGGSIWRSDDFGDTWDELTDAGTGNWSCVSYDNGIIYAAISGGNVYYSIDDGTNFGTITSAGTASWTCIASSINRVSPKVYIGAATGSIFDVYADAFISTDKLSATFNCLSVATNYNGSKIFALEDTGITVSKDSGDFWTVPTFDSASGVIACSNDGKTSLLAGSNFAFLSKDYGANYSNCVNAPAEVITGAYISGSGATMAVCADADFVYTITDNGETWVQRDVIGGSTAGDWVDITGDFTGAKLAVCANTGYIYTSGDSGATWTQRDSSRAWSGIASDRVGLYLLACVYNGDLYLSTNSGVSWTPYTLLGNLNWSSVTIDAVGLYLYACDDTNIYMSQNAGTTWAVTVADTHTYTSIKCSDDGKYVVAAHMTGVVASYDYGTTWVDIETGGTSNIRKVAINSDASITYVEEVGATNGKKYTRYNTENSIVSTTTGFPSTGNWAFVTIDVDAANAIVLRSGYGDGAVRPATASGETYFDTLQHNGYYYGSWNVDRQRVIAAIHNGGVTRNVYSPERSKDYYYINLGNEDEEYGENDNGIYIKRKDGTMECNHFILCTTNSVSGSSSLYLDSGTVSTYSGSVSWAFPTEFSNVSDIIVTSEDEYGSHTYIMAKSKSSVALGFELGYPNTIFYKRVKAVGRWK